MMHDIFNKIKKIGEFTESMVSRGLWDARAPEHVTEIREISCHGSEELNIEPCPERTESTRHKDSFICGACGCGDFPHTQLTNITEKHYSKLQYPRVNCPRNMPGFTNYIPLTISENNTRKGLIEGIFGVEYLSKLNDKENPSGQELE